MAPADPVALLTAARSGDRAALARTLTLVERGGDAARAVAAAAHERAGAAHVVGITGPPGAGKSTLTAAVVAALRAGGARVAVLAVDPSSPFTGGALLGDRLRMQQHDLDEGAYVRSLATRGHLGGLAVAVPDAVRVLDAVGFPWVLVETVGVGQVEVAVAEAADTTVVVLNPGWGDEVQAAKAGLLEVADVYVVNKADRPGAAEVVRDLQRVLALSSGGRGGWAPPVLTTVGTDGTGVDALVGALRAHRVHQESTGGWAARRAARAAAELRAVLAAVVSARVRGAAGEAAFADAASDVAAQRVDPWTAAERLLGAAGLRGGPGPEG